MLKTTKYLYDMKAKEIENVPYKKALQMKIIKAKNLVNDLLNAHYMDRDDERLLDIVRAIKYNEKLLAEMEE